MCLYVLWYVHTILLQIMASLYKRLVLFSCWGKQHYNKTKRQVLNKRRVFCVPLIILSTWYFQAYSFPPSLSNMTDAGQ